MNTKLLSLILVLGITISATADEGMWQLSQIKSLKLQEKGLKMDSDDIYDPDGGGLTDAILSMGGCSASFISKNGLIATVVDQLGGDDCFDSLTAFAY